MSLGACNELVRGSRLFSVSSCSRSVYADVGLVG
jgi:hypothetical protein